MITSLLEDPASTASATRAARKSAPAHRVRVGIAVAAAILLVLSLLIYGAGYYLLPLDQRPYSPKHELLKPGGIVGLKLGILGTFLFFLIFLYALRKVVPFLRRGSARQWMDFHVIAGVTAPVLIAFHASFKFRGIAGGAFWIMVAVAFSGVIGRYLYAQIPQSLNAAESSLSELQAVEQELRAQPIDHTLYSMDRLNRALRAPSMDHVRNLGALRGVGEMLLLDICLPFRIASLRRSSCGFGALLLCVGGLLPTGDADVEAIVWLVRKKASLSKRILFLDKTRRVFHLWHVVHRPFSYAFAILALMHIMVVLGLGFGKLGLH
jgi:hypothetical protein